MSTLTDIDLETLVGPLEPIPCEHTQHTKRLGSHDTGPATHYAQAHCHYCGGRSEVEAVCEGYTQAVKQNAHMICRYCSVISPAEYLTSILGPITTTA